MAAIEISERLKQRIDAALAGNGARSVSAFVEEAVMRLLEDQEVAADDLDLTIARGIADMESGRFIHFETVAASREFHRQLLTEVLDEASDKQD